MKTHPNGWSSQELIKEPVGRERERERERDQRRQNNILQYYNITIQAGRKPYICNDKSKILFGPLKINHRAVLPV